MPCTCKNVKVLVTRALSNHGSLSLVFGYKHNPEILMQFFNLSELHENTWVAFFSTCENCMISFFGQPWRFFGFIETVFFLNLLFPSWFNLGFISVP